MTSDAIRKKPITRKRESLTCTACKSRKLKCSKQLPACSSCVKRGDAAICTYNKASGLSSEIQDGSGTSSSAQAELRLRHLETLVHDLIKTTPGNADASSHSLRDSNAQVEVAGIPEGRLYTGPTHHAAMLEDIEQLRLALGDTIAVTDADVQLSARSDGSSEMDVLFGRARPLNLHQILNRWLPPKAECDIRLAAYFHAEGIAAPFVHKKQFYHQYETFWKDRSQTPTLWISILFSIFYLSERTGPAVDSDPPGFRYAATQCLAAGHYSKPQQYAVEAITAFVQARLTDGLDPCRDLGILLGVLVPLAYTLGYHRDPKRLRDITPFEGEMRRRTWTLIIQLDLLNSFQSGLPHNLQAGTWDTSVPGNYNDADLDESMQCLPEPRLNSEITRMTFYISKLILMEVFAKILKYALCTKDDFQETHLLQREQELDEAYMSIPEALHQVHDSEAYPTPIVVVVTRRCLQLMYEKCRLVLHRKHITLGREASTRIACDAAVTITRAFLEMYPEFKPGGLYHADRWLMSSITFNDFLLCVMALCLILCQDRKAYIACLSHEERRALRDILEASREICRETSLQSTGAARMNRLLEALNPLLVHEEELPPVITVSNDDVSIAQSDFGLLFPEAATSWPNMFEDPAWLFMEEFLGSGFECDAPVRSAT